MKFYVIWFVLLLVSPLNFSYSQTCPEVNNPIQNFCDSNVSTVADLLPSDAIWYTSNDPGAIALSPNDELINEGIYFAGNLNGNCDNRLQVSVNIYQTPDAGSDKQAYLCGTSSGALFNNFTEVRNYFTNMLDEGVPKDGTFDPTLREINEEYWSSPVEGSKDLNTTYTVGEFGCEDAVELTVTVYEYVNAGEDGEVILEDSSPIDLFQYLDGNPSEGGTWSGLEDGIFDPLSDEDGAYTYSVGNNLCSVSSTLMVSYTGGNDLLDCNNLFVDNENVGIGTANPGSYVLAVDGGIYTDEVKVMNVDTWPDYVFSESYNLMDLEEVASYIEEEGHLPGLPSAEEVLSDGISLTEIDKSNLKKVEELSLYLLDQHGRMESLRNGKVQKSSVLAYRADNERPYNFILDQSGIAEGQAELKTMSTDSLSTGNMYCDGDNVGIGIGQTFGYRLAVAGGILSAGVKVSSVSNWPDYVFSDDYAMLSLDDLRAYISTNKHLPGLPSAKTIAREGYSLSEMDKLLLEKVEELTLYVIEQEAELESLSGELGVILPVRDEEFVSNKTVYKSHNVDIESYLTAPVQREGRTFRDASLRSMEGSTEALCDVISCDGEGVGIGTEPVAGYRLAVSGGILTDDIQVASVANWPDYVFEADYKLRDLSSLSAYIEREGHLPGIPKAELVEQEGYHLEVMDGLLLEKIEELTLYLIRQERQLTFLESRQ
ncbi:hypothetical protein SAMN05660903_00942 [Salegentibacter salinarum]|nr:hypothetical protein SAMN05660903_00942 [Salegentibacter salinarum]